MILLHIPGAAANDGVLNPPTVTGINEVKYVFEMFPHRYRGMDCMGAEGLWLEGFTGYSTSVKT